LSVNIMADVCVFPSDTRVPSASPTVGLF